MTTQTREWPGLSDVVESIGRIVQDATDIGCLAHKDADADSLGSALAFALSLRAMGKRTHPLVPSPKPQLLEYLPGFEQIETEPVSLDALFTFDCATISRFGDRRDLVETIRPVVNVDHHVSSDGFGTVNLVDPSASATGQVVYALLRALDAPVTPDVATNLYAALFTDTGGFRHENTTEAALRLGADPGWVALKSYKSRSVSRVRLESLATAAMRTELDGALIWSEVTQEMLQRAGADMQESEGVIDQLQSIDTMRLAVLFKEHDGGITKISVRSRDPLDATDVCTPFGGGGHHRAAGAELRLSMQEAEQQVLEVARNLVTGTP
jgi:phosphoesterase RecJ-like protein